MDAYVKKAARAAGTLCAAAGVISVAVSGAALAVAVKSIKYAKDAVCKLMDDTSVKENSIVESECSASEDVTVDNASGEVKIDTVETTEETPENEN